MKRYSFYILPSVAFMSWRCISDREDAGLFFIDKNGQVVWTARGKTPYDTIMQKISAISQ